MVFYCCDRQIVCATSDAWNANATLFAQSKISLCAAIRRGKYAKALNSPDENGCRTVIRAQAISGKYYQTSWKTIHMMVEPQPVIFPTKKVCLCPDT